METFLPEEEQARDLEVLRIKVLSATPSWGGPVPSGHQGSQERGIDVVGCWSWGKASKLTEEQNE